MHPRIKCLLCDNSVHSRGLCSRCYASAREKVAKGVTTWEQLEEMGLALALRSNRHTNPLTAAFNKALEERKRYGLQD